jgi:hypothetical protein
MSEKLILNYDNFENSLLSQEFDKKSGIKSFSEYVTKNCNCVCTFNDTDNQEDMDDDSWILTFKDQECLSNFCVKYNFSAENCLLIRTQNNKKLKL